MYQDASLSSSNTLSSCFWKDTSTCVLGTSTSEMGYFKVDLITDTFMRVIYKPNSNLNFGTTHYYHNFIITYNGFTFGSGCNVTNVDF